MIRSEILKAAEECVCSSRQADYGPVENNFSTIAELWTAYKGIELTAVDVAIFLSLVKIGRIASGHGKADNWIDLAGYAACGGEIESAIVTEFDKHRNFFKNSSDTLLRERAVEIDHIKLKLLSIKKEYV